MATNSARPALASHAEKASSRMGAAEKAVASSCNIQRARARNRDSIMPSKQSSADIK